MALLAEIAVTLVNVAFIRGPSKQFRPAKAFGVGLPGVLVPLLSTSSLVFEGGDTLVRQTLA